MPVDEDWCVLHKGGKAGLYIELIALSWWVGALTPEIPSFCTWTSICDVWWVIDQISTKLCTPAMKKWLLVDGARVGKAKRYAIACYSFLLY